MEAHGKECIFATRSFTGTNLIDFMTASIIQPQLPFAPSIQLVFQQVQPGQFMDTAGLMIVEDLLNDVFARLCTSAMALAPPSLIGTHSCIKTHMHMHTLLSLSLLPSFPKGEQHAYNT
jgi:hypothetical protein